MNYLRDLTVLILGLGDSGLAMARWCARCGAQVHVTDTRSAPPHAAALAQAVPQATLHQGVDVALLAGVNVVLKSPGLSPLDPALQPLLAAAQERGIAVRGELSLFASALMDLKQECGYAPQVIAITGTNGKTTTTSLTAQLVERTGKRVGLAGNIGPTLLDTLAQALDAEPATQLVLPLPEESPALEPAEHPVADAAGASLSSAVQFQVLPEVWVLELSSFQLDGVDHFDPSVATVLNVTQDHVDWHGSMPAYAAAKAHIYGRQTVLVINRDDPLVRAMVPAPVMTKTAKGRTQPAVRRKVISFGLDAPQQAGDYGVLHDGGLAWLVRAVPMDEAPKRPTGVPEEFFIQRLMPADALRIRGRHNAANALAALALTTSIGLPLAPMLHGLREYRGEPHRVEHVATIQSVDAYDDSKGTNVGATVAALTGLGTDLHPSKLIVILGGDGKGQDFSPLRAPIQRYARAVALIGRDASALEAVLKAEAEDPASIVLTHHATLEAATAWAFEQARAGDAVLLSPACASLDMFRNYAHRAQVFCDTVHSLAIERGTAV